MIYTKVSDKELTKVGKLVGKTLYLPEGVYTTYSPSIDSNFIGGITTPKENNLKPKKDAKSSN